MNIGVSSTGDRTVSFCIFSTLSQRLSLFLSLAPYLSLSLSLPFLQSKMMKLFIEKVVVVK